MADSNEGLSRNREAFYEALGHAIKVERTAQGLGRRELADRAGISYPYLSEIENGAKRAGPKPLLLIARALGVTQSDLMRIAEEQSEARTAQTASAPAMAAEEPVAMNYASKPMMATASWRRSRADDVSSPGRRAVIGEVIELLSTMSQEKIEKVRDFARDLAP
jgi:transcriptional regulator with XRE-family HTH domain